jgi:hypothetical protein
MPRYVLFLCVLYFSRKSVFGICSRNMGSRDSIVGMTTGYGLEDRGIGVQAPVRSRIFSSPQRPDRFWGPPSLLSNGYRRLFPGGKAAEAWSYCRSQENVGLYIHSPTRLHGVGLNYLSTESTSPYLSRNIKNVSFLHRENCDLVKPRIAMWLKMLT